jgi:2-polyprenyl-3-methyl-5-hydroxy-6-metoxy-1,4-benzoquinol methylase
MRQNIYDNPQFFEGYRRLRASPGTLNDVLEQPAIRATLPNLAGRHVLDLGCGMGQLALYCVQQGAASVVGTDISENMIAVARQTATHPQIEYRVAPIEDLEFPPARFDLVLSSLALHYVADYAGVVRNVARWLRPGGHFIYTVHHPILSASRAVDPWIRDQDGQLLHWAIDDYGDESRRELEWMVSGVIVYHRTLATLLNTLIDHGLQIERVLEPEALPEAAAANPQLLNERRRPPFLLVRSRREE